MRDVFANSQIFKGIEFRFMGLILEKILVLLFILDFRASFKDNESASSIAKSQISTSVIKSKGSNVIFFNYLLTFSLVSKQLGTTVLTH